MNLEICVICGKPVDENSYIKCAICGKLMHRSCASDEALIDAEENIMCPYDAILAALDWLDIVITTYANSLSDEERKNIVKRLESYQKLLLDK